MATSLVGLRGALQQLNLPLIFLFCIRIFVRFFFFITGLNLRVPKFARYVSKALEFAALATATTGIASLTFLDNEILYASFEDCTPNTHPRSNGMVAGSLLLLFFASNGFFSMLAAIHGLKMLADGTLSMAFASCNLALVSSISSTSSHFGEILAGLFHLVVFQTAQLHSQRCHDFDATRLASLVWFSGTVFSTQVLYRYLRKDHVE